MNERVTKLGKQKVDVFVYKPEKDADTEILEEVIDVKAIYEGRLHVILGIDEDGEPVAMYHNPLQGYKYLINPSEMDDMEMWEYGFEEDAQLNNSAEVIKTFKKIVAEARK